MTAEFLRWALTEDAGALAGFRRTARSSPWVVLRDDLLGPS
jgi:hypothetical protein